MESIFDWPGKSDDQGNTYPAVRHMLDVAACAERLIERHVAFLHLSRAQHRALTVLIALHDVGKLSESFRALVQNHETGSPLHWELSDFLLRDSLEDLLCELGACRDARQELYAAVAGHHGRPPSITDQREGRKRKRAIGEGEAVGREWVAQLLGLFPGASLEDIAPDDAKKLSWALSGLTIVSDWVGSNQEWFPFKPESRNIHEALTLARKSAAIAVEQAGLAPPGPRTPDPAVPLGMTNLRPMQWAVSQVMLADGPKLAVIEDSTGTGKTEAALILAQRMIASGKARGLFFALPTMATSDAMLDRVRRHAPALFAEPPSVLLTHSRAVLSRRMRALYATVSDNTPEAEGGAWLTDSRRRALLATVGVGTVDQALLGILPTRFSTLRLFGLADKVLIVDEAHSYEPYMKEQLEALLRMQARLGGSAILMTATLPLAMRRAYVAAFRDGLGKAERSLATSCYPGLHLVGHDVQSHTVDPASASVRTVSVRRLSSADSAFDLLMGAAESGAAAVWVRNAVDDAIEAIDELRQRGVEADLLHARFAMTDRLRHEQALMRRFGRDGEGRRGRILVATQVVEASLDLDFDAMVSDLAPIGSLIQRAGRLWRHMDLRPARERPVPGPRLHVVSPDPDSAEGEHWLLDVLGRGAWVYRLDEQWLTAKAIFDAGEIAAPGGLRALIEAVHGDARPEVPSALTKAALEAEGRAWAETGLARRNIVDGDAGYRRGNRGAVGDDAQFPTRLGEPQVTLVLARRRGDELVPWADHEDPDIAWALSELSTSRKRFERLLPNQDTPEIRVVKRHWPEWRQRNHWLCVVEAGCVNGDRLLYTSDEGLRIDSPPSRG